MVRFACAPNDAPNDAWCDSASDTTSVAILSRSTPPYSSGMLVPSSPSSPHFFINCRASDHSFCSSRSLTGTTSPSMNSIAVCRIIACSSVIFSGVITVAGSVSPTSHAPPLTVCSLVAVAI